MNANDRSRQHRPAVAAAIVVALLVALGGGPASAASVRRTQGDARAAFNAEPGAGFTIGLMVNPHGTPAGAPAGGITTGSPEDVRIYPNADGSYCASGWHVMFLGVWVNEFEVLWGSGTYRNYTDAFAYLNSVDVQFAWDGVPLVVERTPNKRMNNFPDPWYQDAFRFQIGSFMPPGTLSVGEHLLSSTMVDPLFGDDSWSVNVTILPC